MLFTVGVGLVILLLQVSRHASTCVVENYDIHDRPTGASFANAIFLPIGQFVDCRKFKLQGILSTGIDIRASRRGTFPSQLSMIPSQVNILNFPENSFGPKINIAS
jgi:hypothetical protein